MEASVRHFLILSQNSSVVLTCAIGIGIAHESVSCLTDREKMNRLGRTRFEGLSQLPHDLIGRPRVHVAWHFPDVFQQLGSGNHQTFMLYEVLQNFDL